MSTSAVTSEITADLNIEKKSHDTMPGDKAQKMSAESRRLIIGAVALVIIAVGSYIGYESYTFVSTDNASIEAKSTYLSSRVGGIVTDVSVTENQNVKAGQVLAHIRTSEYQNALIEAQSEYDSLAAQLKAAEQSYKRALILSKEGAFAPERLESAESQFKSLEAKLKTQEAHVEQAKLNLADTELKAPSDGKIAKKSVEVGMMAGAGQPLFGFVSSDERWATANFKETEMKGIVPGKTAEVEVDAISGQKFEAVVESISPSTGATFSLLPPDNATGNFTKVVQRVPVRLKLVHLKEQDIELLQAGLSAEVKVKLH